MSFIQGDALNPDSYKSQLQDVDAVIHTLGVLLPGSGNRSYQAMNRDAAINVANDLDKWAKEYGEERQFVMLSSARAPPGQYDYLAYKLEAEQHILKECKNLKGTMIRPGYVYDSQERWWSTALKPFVNIYASLDEALVAKNPNLEKPLSMVFPVRSVPLTSLGHFCI